MAQTAPRRRSRRVVRGPAQADRGPRPTSATPSTRGTPDRTQSAKVKWDRRRSTVKKGSWEYAVDLANWSLLRRTPLAPPAAGGDGRLLVEPLPRPVDPRPRRGAGATSTTRCCATARSASSTTCWSRPACTPRCCCTSATTSRPRTTRTRTRAASCSSCTRSGVDAGYTEDDGQGLGEDPHRLHRQRLGATGSPATTRTIHWTRPGQGARLRRRQHRARRSRRSPRHTCATSPTTRRPHDASRRSWRCDSCPTHPSTGLIDDLARRLPRVGHRHQGDPAGARRPPRVRRVGRREGAQPDRGLHRHRARPRRQAKRPQADGCDWPFAEAQIWMCQGQYPFMWPRPDGMPQSNDAWSSASQVLGSLDTHYSLSGGWVGDTGLRATTAPERLVAAAAADPVRRLRRPPLAGCCSAASRRRGC